MKNNFKDIIKASVESEVIDAQVQAQVDAAKDITPEEVEAGNAVDIDAFMQETTQAMENLLEQIEVTQQAAELEEKQEAENGVLDQETEELLNAVVGSTGYASESDDVSFKDKAKNVIEKFIAWLKEKWENVKLLIKSLSDAKAKLAVGVGGLIKNIDNDSDYTINTITLDKESDKSLDAVKRLLANTRRSGIEGGDEQEPVKFGARLSIHTSKKDFYVMEDIDAEKNELVFTGLTIQKILSKILNDILPELERISVDIAKHDPAKDIPTSPTEAELEEIRNALTFKWACSIASKRILNELSIMVNEIKKAKKVGEE